MTLSPGTELCFWQVTPLTEEEFNVEACSMHGDMDPTFFLTRNKNFIPHTYPCREKYIEDVRDIEPFAPAFPNWSGARNIVPQGSDSLDLSGFWFRATRISGWARTAVTAARAGPCKMTISVCGAAKVFVNAKAVTWLAPATRNAPSQQEFSALLQEGSNEISVWFEELAERDALIQISIRWLQGPQSVQGHCFDVAPDVFENISQALNSMHLNKWHYDCEGIILVLPCTFSRPVTLDIIASGHFMARHKASIRQDVEAGQTEVFLFDSKDLPSDFRYFDVTISCGGFVVSGRLAAEISNHSSFQRPSAELSERIDETLAWLAANGEGNAEVALACLAVGGMNEIARAERIIELGLEAIERCHDCADFLLVPLIWAQTRYAGRMAGAQTYRLRQAILNYRYWMDEPGNDVQWYFSENHALLFHTAAYSYCVINFRVY